MTKRSREPYFRFVGSGKPTQEAIDLAKRFYDEFIDINDWDNLRDGRSKIGGSAKAPSRAKPKIQLEWLKIFSNYSGDECICYPWATVSNPRGQVSYGLTKMPAAKGMCRIVNKLPPEGRDNALHSCGNGHLGCVNPNHVYWGNHKDNMTDMHEHKREGKPFAALYMDSGGRDRTKVAYSCH